jgi:hypothetical protein
VAAGIDQNQYAQSHGRVRAQDVIATASTHGIHPSHHRQLDHTFAYIRDVILP